MKIIVKPAKETYVDADWVSRIKLLRQDIGQLIPDSPQGIENIKYTVEHIEVFKVKPDEIYYLVAKWNDIPASFIEEMKTFQS